MMEEVKEERRLNDEEFERELNILKRNIDDDIKK